MKKWISHPAPGTLLKGAALVIGIAASSTSLLAATYNLYFNNTEQGANSTATPNVTIGTTANTNQPNSEKPVSTATAPVMTPTVKEVPPAEEEAAENAEVAEAAPEPSTAPEQTTESAPEAKNYGMVGKYFTGPGLASAKVFIKEDVPKKWAFSMGAYVGKVKGGHDDYGGVVDPYDYMLGAGGVQAALDYNFLSYMGLTFSGGLAAGYEATKRSFLATELNLIPVKLNLFGFDDVLEVGALLGISTMARASGNVGSLYVGAKGTWNFGDKYFIQAALKGNKGFAIASGGLGMKF